MDEDWALEVFDKAPYVTVSMIRPDGIPYGLPLSVVRKDNRTFYFHCAAEGEKIDCIRNNPVVSLSAVSRCMGHKTKRVKRDGSVEGASPLISVG